jgi:hypothetical protein
MSELELSRAEEIRRLHEEIIGAVRVTLPKAIRIGELLAEQKTEMEHGSFGPWIEAHCGFTERTAQRYMRLAAVRESLKSDSVSGLTAAYRLLEAPRAEEWEGLDILEWYRLAVAELRFVMERMDAIFAHTRGQDSQKLALWKELSERALELAQLGGELNIKATTV